MEVDKSKRMIVCIYQSSFSGTKMTRIKADSREEALEKSKKFYGNHLQILGEAPIKDFDNLSMGEIDIFWKKGMPDKVDTTLKFNAGRLMHDVREKLRKYKKEMDDYPEVADEALTFLVKEKFNIKEVSDDIMDPDKHKWYLELFKLGILRAFIEKEDEEQVLYNIYHMPEKYEEDVMELAELFDCKADGFVKNFHENKKNSIIVFGYGIICSKAIEFADN